MIIEIGCCGAYCKTCGALADKSCLGCKLGYENGERDINKAKCKMKVCCFKERKFETCADCLDYPSCKIIEDFYNKNGYKYRKYRQSIEFIRDNGYASFLEIADNWKGPYGKFD
ncbi:MAG: DUF3795 domain-containing protein [Methanosarcinaceae archaeon]|nr:DUF3795 domain-containing protein [Methanosarcinaceae archaeon]